MIKVDATQGEIVRQLRVYGAVVELIQSATGKSGIPDLLVGYYGQTYLLEVKAIVGKKNPRAAPLNEGQVAWHAAWKGGKVYVVSTPQEALDIVVFS